MTSPAALRALKRQRICESTIPGKRRDALLWKHCYSREVLATREERIKTALKIHDKHSGLPIPFVFNRPQQMLEVARQASEAQGVQFRPKILKARKFGVSMQFVGWGLEGVLWEPHFQGAIVANVKLRANALLEEARFMLSAMPVHIPTKYNNRGVVALGPPHNASLLIASAEDPAPCRGGSFRFIHNTETAFWKNAEKKISGIHESIPNEAGTVLGHESTANGLGNWWHDYYFSKTGTAYFFPWWFDPAFDYCLPVHPGEEEPILATLTDEERELVREGVTTGQLKWRRAKIAEMNNDLDEFNQEYPATAAMAFRASGSRAFSPKSIEVARRHCREPMYYATIRIRGEHDGKLDYEIVKERGGPLMVWAEPKENGCYVMGIDSAEGIQRDNSVAQVMDVHTCEQVASFISDKIEPTALGRYCACLGWWYREAIAYPETKTPGLTTLRAMAEAGYSRIARREATTGYAKVESVLGWDTNVRTKSLMYNDLRALFSSGEIIVRDSVLLDEAERISIEDGKYVIPKNRHDDRVDALAITVQARRRAFDTAYFPEKPKDPEDMSFDKRHWRAHEEEIARRVAGQEAPEEVEV